METDMDLQELLDKAAEQGTDKQRTTAVKAAISGLDRPALDNLLNEVLDKYSTLNDTDPVDADSLLGLQLLATVATVTREAQETADAEVERIRAERDELTAKVLGTEEPPAEPEPESAEVAEGAADEAAEVAEPVAEVAEPAAPAEVAPELVTASAVKRFSLASIKGRAPAPEPSEPAYPGVEIVAAAAIRGMANGSQLTTDQLVDATTEQLGSMPRSELTASGGLRPRTASEQVVKVKQPIAQFRNVFPPELVASGRGDDDVIKRAVDAYLTTGLVAAGGWCAPSERLYDLVPLLADAKAGLIDIPEIAVKRGGIITHGGVDFRDVWAGNAGLIQTEAQAIAGDDKAFYRPVCPPTDNETRADAFYSGLIVGNLQDNAYPEVTKQTIEGVMAVHAHRMNASTISRIEAKSTAVNLSGLGPSATGSVLNGLELIITDARYRYRAPESMTLEVVLPLWLRSVIRSDLSLRAGDGDYKQVTNQQIDGYFGVRGAKVQWVYDWQDAYTTSPAAGFGAVAAITAFPTTVKALVYPAGSFVRLRGEVLNLDSVYDSTNTVENDYLRLFVEEKLGVHQRGYQSLVATIPLGVRGATATGEVLDNQGKPVPVAGP